MRAESRPGTSFRLEDPARRCRVAQQPVARPDRPAHQFAGAIGTMVAEHSFGALAAKRALIGADPGVERMGRQIPVAAFAIGPQFQHRHAIPMVPAPVYRAREGWHWRAAFAMRDASSRRIENPLDPSDWNVRQPAQRLLFECGAGDPAREILRPRRPKYLRSPADSALQSGFRGRETARACQGAALGDHRKRRARALRTGVQPQHSRRLEERARLGLAPCLHLGDGV